MRHAEKAKRTVPSLFILVLMISVGPFGDTLYTPSLPAIADDLNAYYSSVQLTMTFYLLGYAASQLVYGPLSDRFGRKPVMIGGAALFVIGSLICMLSFDVSLLIIGRFIQGLGACAGAVISSASVRDAFPPQKRGKIFARMNLAFAIAPGVGPLIGSMIAHYSWHYNFLLLLILSFLLLVLVIFIFPETLDEKNHHAIHPKQLLVNYFSLFKAPGYLAYLCLLGLSLGMVYGCLVEAPRMITEVMQLTPKWFILIAAGIVLAFMMGSGLCNYLVGRLGSHGILLTGILIMFLSSLSFIGVIHYLPLQLATMLPPIILIFSGIALVIPVATTGALAPFSSIIGSASAMLGFFQMGSASLITALVTLINQILGPIYTMPVSFTLLSCTALLLHGLFMRFGNRPRHY